MAKKKRASEKDSESDCQFEEIVKLFAQSEDKDQDCPVPVLTTVQSKCKGGFRYFYSSGTKENPDEGAVNQDWRSDGYLFRQNGKKQWGNKKCGGVKMYFKLRVTGGYTFDFEKVVYTHSGFPNKVLIEYLGDETVAEDLPHGNAKRAAKKSQPYFRSKPSLLKKIQDKVLNDKGELPSEIYKVGFYFYFFMKRGINVQFFTLQGFGCSCPTGVR